MPELDSFSTFLGEVVLTAEFSEAIIFFLSDFDFEKQTISLYDSGLDLGFGKKYVDKEANRRLRTIHNFIKHVIAKMTMTRAKRRSIQAMKWSKSVAKGMKMQLDGSACGVFMLSGIFPFLEGKEHVSLCQTHVPLMRKYFLVSAMTYDLCLS